MDNGIPVNVWVAVASSFCLMLVDVINGHNVKSIRLLVNAPSHALPLLLDLAGGPRLRHVVAALLKNGIDFGLFDRGLG